MVNHHELKEIGDLRPASYNPRKISAKAAEGLAKSLGDFGDLSGVVWNERTGNLVCGHQRVDQLRRLGGQIIGGAIQIASGDRFPIRVVDWAEAKEKAANVVANNPSIGGNFDDGIDAVLDEIRASIGEKDFEELCLDDLAASLSVEAEAEQEPAGVSLAERFGVPPFSVLDARRGYWQDRKRAWLGLGIKSEVGRGDCTPGGGGAKCDTTKKDGRMI
jgi:hypothetical protein